MTIEVELVDKAAGKRAKIVDGGALAVLPPEYNQIFSATVVTADTPFNIAPPKPDEYFVGNTLVISSNKTVSQTVDATVQIYSAPSAETPLLPSNVEVLPLQIARSSTIVIPNMNIRTVDKGAYINVVSSDIEIFVTLFGYYTREDK